MSREYRPKGLPTFPSLITLEDAVQFFMEELEEISDVVNEQRAGILLEPQALLPEKYEEGTVVNFIEGALDADGESLSAGLHIRRDGAWRKLQEVT